MITLKTFVETIQNAVAEAADTIAAKNLEIMRQYFVPKTTEPNSLEPRSVELTVPDEDEDGHKIERTVNAPLICLVPFNTAQIEKATLSADFKLVSEKDEIYIAFPDEKTRKEISTAGRLEITITPTGPSEGMQKIIDAYSDTLSKQL